MPVIAAIDQSTRSESVLREAKRLADGAGAELHVVYVGDTTVPNPESGYDPERGEYISEKKAAGIARDAVSEALGDVDVEIVGLTGDPASELLRYADEHDSEYIVVSARKRTPIGQAVFGSVTQSLLLNAQCPIVATPHEPA